MVAFWGLLGGLLGASWVLRGASGGLGLQRQQRARWASASSMPRDAAKQALILKKPLEAVSRGKQRAAAYISSAGPTRRRAREAAVAAAPARRNGAFVGSQGAAVTRSATGFAMSVSRWPGLELRAQERAPTRPRERSRKRAVLARCASRSAATATAGSVARASYRSAATPSAAAAPAEGRVAGWAAVPPSLHRRARARARRGGAWIA